MSNLTIRYNMKLIEPTHTLYLVMFRGQIYWGRYEQRESCTTAYYRSRPLILNRTMEMTYTGDILCLYKSEVRKAIVF